MNNTHKQQKPKLRCDGCKTMCFKCDVCINNSLTSKWNDKKQSENPVINPKIIKVNF
jgi:hypothetical protein